MAHSITTAEDRAHRAAKEFQKLSSSLTRYAQAMAKSAGDKSKYMVVAGSKTMTDGKKIFIRPPLSLADNVQHDTFYCDTRDDNGTLECAACAKWEELYFHLYHEISHCVNGSFGSVRISQDQAQKFRKVINSVPGMPADFADCIADQVDYWSSRVISDPQYVINSIYLNSTFMFMVTEDTRIDELASIERPGVREMRYWQSLAVLRDGIEMNDGSFTMWRDSPLKNQVPIGILFQTGGVDIVDHLTDDTVTIVDALETLNLIRIPESLTDSFLHAIMLCAVICHLTNGAIFPHPEYPKQDEPEPEPESENDNAEQGEPGNGNSGGEQSERNYSDNEDSGSEDGSGIPEYAEQDDTQDENSSENQDDTQDENSSENQDENQDGNSDDVDADTNPEQGTNSGMNAGAEDSENAGQDSVDSDSSEDENSEDTEDSGSGSGSSNNPDGTEQSSDTGDNNDADGTDESGEGSVEISEEEFNRAMEKALGHDNESHRGNQGAPQSWEEREANNALDRAVEQVSDFDSYSINIAKLNVHVNGKGAAFEKGPLYNTIDPQESRKVISSSLMKARKVFGDSKIDRYQRNQKAGRVSGRSLYRFQLDDDRLFQKRQIAEGVDFDIIIGLDISGSTAYGAIRKIRNIGFFTAELFSKVGVNFGMYAHTTGRTNTSRVFGSEMTQEMFEIKSLKSAWNTRSKELCQSLKPCAGSLDGHNFEFYRKKLERESRAKKKMIIYFTDGQIPETNHREEVEILNRELKLCKKAGIGILAIGVETDSPKKYGLDTIKVNSSTDLKTVINEIEKRII